MLSRYIMRIRRCIIMLQAVSDEKLFCAVLSQARVTCTQAMQALGSKDVSQASKGPTIMDTIRDHILVSGVYHCERYTGVIVSSRANTAYTSGLQILYTVALDTPIKIGRA